MMMARSAWLLQSTGMEVYTSKLCSTAQWVQLAILSVLLFISFQTNYHAALPLPNIRSFQSS